MDMKRGYRVLANIDTSFTEKTSTAEVYEIFKDTNATGLSILLDEIQKDLNSAAGYTSTKLLVEFCNIASAQTRKRDINLYWTTQRAYDVPLKLRGAQTDILLQPVKVHSDMSRCTRANCDRKHYIAVYAREPMRHKPIVILDCAKFTGLYNTNQVLTDKMVVD
jgi:hypothetical protein